MFYPNKKEILFNNKPKRFPSFETRYYKQSLTSSQFYWKHNEPTTANEFRNIFEDTRKTKILFGKYIITRNMLCFLIFVNILLSLMLYEFIAVELGHFPYQAKIISLTISITQIFTVLMWAISLWVYGELKKEKLILGKNENFIFDYGLRRFLCILSILLVHPVFFSVDVPCYFSETYYRLDTVYEAFHRPLAEYCIMIQFVVGTGFAINILLENIKFANNRADRIARFFGIEADAIFVLRACMRRYPLKFVCCLEIFGVLFFGVLVRIAETNYIQHIPPGLDREDFLLERSNRILFFNYTNIFWNMIITMTTIGYGDFTTRGTLSRMIIILTGFYGILVTSLLVVAFTNLLEMESNEDNAFKMYKSIQASKNKDKAAIKLTSNIFLDRLKKVQRYSPQ